MDTVQLYSKGPLAESLNAFLRSLEGKNRSELTRKAYHTDMLQFFIWLKENNSYATSPDKITKTDLTEFLSACVIPVRASLSAFHKGAVFVIEYGAANEAEMKTARIPSL